jgi:Flp pilus assembly protein CpaB
VQNALATRFFGERANRFLSTRRGTVILGAVAALLAALLLLAYLNQYRNSVSAAGSPTPVLVANRLIPKGTSATIMAGEGFFQLATIPQKHLKAGAVADPATIQGRVAVRDLAPGQQLTVADFSTTLTEAIPTRITGTERAISIPVDATNGMVGHLAAGDRVDVYVAIDGGAGGIAVPVVKLLLADVYIMAAPGAAGGGIGGTTSTAYVLRVETSQAGRFAFAAEHGRFWLIARPGSGAKPSKAPLVTAQNLLFGR